MKNTLFFLSRLKMRNLIRDSNGQIKASIYIYITLPYLLTPIPCHLSQALGIILDTIEEQNMNQKQSFIFIVSQASIFMFVNHKSNDRESLLSFFFEDALTDASLSSAAFFSSSVSSPKRSRSSSSSPAGAAQ